MSAGRVAGLAFLIQKEKPSHSLASMGTEAPPASENVKLRLPPQPCRPWAFVHTARFVAVTRVAYSREPQRVPASTPERYDCIAPGSVKCSTGGQFATSAPVGEFAVS